MFLCKNNEKLPCLPKDNNKYNNNNNTVMRITCKKMNNKSKGNVDTY